MRLARDPAPSQLLPRLVEIPGRPPRPLVRQLGEVVAADLHGTWISGFCPSDGNDCSCRPLRTAEHVGPGDADEGDPCGLPSMAICAAPDELDVSVTVDGAGVVWCTPILGTPSSSLYDRQAPSKSPRMKSTRSDSSEE